MKITQASGLHLSSTITLPAALERENRNLAYVTDLTRRHLNEISWQFQLDCLSIPQAALWEMILKLTIKWQGMIIWCRTQQSPSMAKHFWAKHARLTTLWPSCWPVLHLWSVQDGLAAHHDILGLIKKCLCEWVPSWKMLREPLSHRWCVIGSSDCQECG